MPVKRHANGTECLSPTDCAEDWAEYVTPPASPHITPAGVRFVIALADLGYQRYPVTPAPIDWRDRFETAHGFTPPFTASEMCAPWCGQCCDFHFDTDDHSCDIV